MLSSEQEAPIEPGVAGTGTPVVKKRTPTLYAIIIFKIIKGLLCVALAVILYHEADKDMSSDFRNFMQQPFVQKVFTTLRIHPESKFFTGLAESVGKLTEANVHRAAWGAVLLSLFPLVEGIGLYCRVSWAGWLAIGESAFFIPIEFYELVKPSTSSASILIVTIINIVIVWYFYTYRAVLFRHH